MSERRKRSNYLKQGGIKAVSLWPLILLLFIKVCFQSYKMGMNGMTYYVLALLLFLFLFALNGLFISPVIKKMVYFQCNKGSYKNASHIYKTLFLCAEILALVFSVVLFFLSDPISQLLFGTILCSLLLKLFAVALPFCVALECMKGYLEGMGTPMPGIMAGYAAALFGLLTTILCQTPFSNYGSRVAALVGQEAYYYAYSAASGVAGIVVGSIVGLLFMLLLKGLFRAQITQQIKNDETRSFDTRGDIIGNYLSIYLPDMFRQLFLIGICFTLLIQYRHLPTPSQSGVGLLFTGFILPGLPAILTASLIGNPLCRQMNAIWRKQDKLHARERVAVNFKLLTFQLFPYLAFLLCLSQLIGETLFDSRAETYVHTLRMGIWSILVLAFAVFSHYIVQALVSRLAGNAVLFSGWVLSAISFLVLQKSKMSGEDMFLFATLAAGLFTFLLSMGIVYKKLRYKEDLLRIFVLPLVAAVLMGIVVYFAQKLFYAFLPGWLTLILCILIAVLVYHLCIVLTHTFDRHEWNEVPAKGFGVFLAKKLNMY